MRPIDDDDDDGYGRTTGDPEAGNLPHTFTGHAHSSRPNMQIASSQTHISNDINMLSSVCPNLSRVNESNATAPWNSAISRGPLMSYQAREVGHPNNTRRGIGYLVNPAAAAAYPMENGEPVNSRGAEASAIRRVPLAFDLIVERHRNGMRRTVRPSFDSSQSVDRRLGVAGTSSLIRPNRNFSSTLVAARLQDSSPSLHGFSPLGHNFMDLAQLRGRSATTQTAAAEFPDSSFNSVGGLCANGEGAGQPIRLHQGHFGPNAINFPSEPSTSYHPIRCAQSGHVTRPSEGTHTQIAQIDRSRTPHLPLRPSHPRISFPGGTRWSQVPETFPFPSPGSAPLPSRLGIQPNDIANAHITGGPQRPFQNYNGSGYMQRPVRPPISSGPRAIHTAPWLNPIRPSPTSTGQLQYTVPVESRKDQVVIPSAAPPFNVGAQTFRPSVQYPGAQVRAQAILPSSDNPRAQLIQPAAAWSEVRPHAIIPSVHSNQAGVIPSSAAAAIGLKRGPPPKYLYSAAQVSQRRKILPPQQQSLYSAAAAAAADPVLPPFHVKWKGFGDPKLPLSGHKCQLCKRDLSFSAEEGGQQLHQPDRPPPVAVLQCGHVFHDLCLERITPSDQTKSPPCIPCAIAD